MRTVQHLIGDGVYYTVTVSNWGTNCINLELDTTNGKASTGMHRHQAERLIKAIQQSLDDN